MRSKLTIFLIVDKKGKAVEKNPNSYLKGLVSYLRPNLSRLYFIYQAYSQLSVFSLSLLLLPKDILELRRHNFLIY